jgi:nucleoside 2-deoxyribosyltransferase
LFKIYVAGPIDADPVTFDWCAKWRKKVEKWAYGKNIKVLNPLRNKNLGYAMTPSEIVMRDLVDIETSDLVLVNVHKERRSKLMWGTPCEVQQAWLSRIPIVMVTDDVEVRDHYWVRHQCVRICWNIDEALDYIKDYWIGE